MSEKKRTIMLGFHSPVDGRLMREWVTGLGYDVVESLDDTADIDLVFMDSASARRLIDRAFALKRAAKYFLPVLAGVKAGENVGRWINAGFDDVLRLPASKAEWKTRIDTMLRLRRQSEELGHKSEMLHKALVESSSDHIFILDANGTYVTSNDRVEHLGFERGDELVGKTIDQVYPKEVAPFYRKQLQRVLNEGKPVVFEHDLPSDRATRYHLDTLYPIKLPDGTVKVGGICRDITDRKNVELALQESEERYRTIVSNIPGGLIHIFDRDLKYVFNAGEELERLGLSNEFLVGKSIHEILPADVATKVEAQYKRVLAGETVRFEGGYGNEFFSLTSAPLRNVKGEIENILTLSVNITERKKAEEALKEAQSNLQALLDNRIDSIWSLDRNYNYLVYNKPYADVVYSNMGVRLEKGLNALDIHPKEVNDFWKPKFDEVFEGKYVTFEFSHVLDGKEHFFEVFMNPIYTDNKVSGLSALSMDITQRKQAEKEILLLNRELEQRVKDRTAQLEASNKELEAFAYSVSHDLRAPLRAIDGFTSILMKEYVENLDDEGKRLGDVIQKNAQKMGQLIDDLLAFSRLGRAAMRFSDIDMKNLVNEIYHDASCNSERERIKFSVADLPDAYGDSNMLRQVWMNLISNAIKYSSKREKAVISITGRQDDEKTTYSISDNGAGFDMQYVNKIFDVFQRLHREEEYPGTGVGLSLVQRIITRHNGKIWAESEVDKGATFYFSLPNKVD